MRRRKKSNQAKIPSYPSGHSTQGYGRKKEGFNQVIEWLTRFDEDKLQELIEEQVSLRAFFE